MLPSELHLKSDFNPCHSARACSECRTDQGFNPSLRSSVMLSYGNQRCPCGKIDMIRPRYVHWHSHCWNVRDIWMIHSTGLHNESCPHWLLTIKLLDDPFLDCILQFASKKFKDSQIHSRIHQAERISGRRNTIEGRHQFKRADIDFHIRRILRNPANFIGSVFAASCDNEAHLGMFFGLFLPLHLRRDFQA